MSNEVEKSCIACRKLKANLTCEVCLEAVCKNCEQFLIAGTFSFLAELPVELSHTHYCPNCYDTHVTPAMASYTEVMEKAKNIYFFFTSQKKTIPLIKRARFGIKVENCPDRDETIMRMAFLAAQQGFTAIIQGDVFSKKIRDNGYQKSSWQGTGIPAHVDVERLERMEGTFPGSN